MAVSYVNSASASSGTTAGAATLSVTMPTITADDVAIYVLQRSGQTALTVTPTGFTLLSNTNITTLGNNVIYYKVLDGTESGTSYTSTWGATSLYCAATLTVYRGVDTSVVFDATTTQTVVTTASTTVTYPSITTTTANSQIIRIAGADKSTIGTTGITFTIPSSPAHTDRVQVTTAKATGGGSVQAAIDVCDYLATSAGATGTAAGTASASSTQVVTTIALRAGVSNLAGSNLRLLTYHTGYYQYAPAYYLGQTSAVSSSAFSVSLTAEATVTRFAGSSLSTTTQLTAGAKNNSLLDSSLAISVGLTASATHIEFADETFAVTAGLTSSAVSSMSIVSSIAFSATLSTDSFVTHSAVTSTSTTATLSADASKSFTASASTSITSSLTAAVSKTVSADVSSIFVESSTAVLSASYNADSNLDLSASLGGGIIRVQPLDSSLSVVYTFTAKIKKSNPITDHDVIVSGQLLPRKWYGQLADIRWEGSLENRRNWQAILADKQWASGMLGERNKFGSLAQRRWGGTFV